MIQVLNRDRWATIFSLLLISLLTFAIYFQLSTHDFLIIDDNIYVTNNQHVKTGLTPQNILWAFTSLEAEFWHPLTWLSYMVDTEIYGVIPGGYLLTNLFIHILNSILLFYLIKLMTNKIWESFVIASLFSLHPIHVEAVAWIAERKELLCTFFWIVASIAYFFYTQKICWQRYILVLILYLMGLMSKSMIITFPFTLLLFDFWPLQRVLKTVLIEKIPLFIITGVGIIITVIAQNKGGGIVSFEEISFTSRVINSITAYFIYIKKIIWPNTLSVFYPVTDISISVFLISLFFLLIISIGVLFFGFKHKFLLTGWLWFLGTLVPVIGIVKIGDFAMADRYTYMPATGLFIIFAFGISWFISKLPFKNLSLVNNLCHILIPLVLLGSYIPNTFFQIQTWRNSESLFNHSLKVTKDNFIAHHAMGELFAWQGDMKKAVLHFQEAVRIRPDKAGLWIKLGRAGVASKDKRLINEDGRLQNEDSRLTNENSKLTNENSKLQNKDGRWSTNIDEPFVKANKLEPQSPKPHFYLVCILLAQNDVMGALQQFFMLAEKNSILKKNQEIQLFKSKFNTYSLKLLKLSADSLKPSDDSLKREKKEIEIFLNKVLGKYGFVKSDEILRQLVISGYEPWEIEIQNKLKFKTDNFANGRAIN